MPYYLLSGSNVCLSILLKARLSVDMLQAVVGRLLVLCVPHELPDDTLVFG